MSIAVGCRVKYRTSPYWTRIGNVVEMDNGRARVLWDTELVGQRQDARPADKKRTWVKVRALELV